VRISRIQLSDHLHPAACAVIRADGSLSLPFRTVDTVYTGTDSSSASERNANCAGVCVGAIVAARSARPNRSGERSGCCCQPGNRYTTHSELDSTSESPHRSRRYFEMIGLLRAPDPGYVGTLSCAATCTATVSGVSGTRNPETRSPLPPGGFDDAVTAFTSVAARKFASPSFRQVRALSSRFSASSCPEVEGTRLSGKRVITRAESFHSASTSTSLRTRPLKSQGERVGNVVVQALDSTGRQDG
jgi:hypothetical protein